MAAGWRAPGLGSQPPGVTPLPCGMPPPSPTLARPTSRMYVQVAGPRTLRRRRMPTQQGGAGSLRSRVFGGERAAGNERWRRARRQMRRAVGEHRPGIHCPRPGWPNQDSHTILDIVFRQRRRPPGRHRSPGAALDAPPAPGTAPARATCWVLPRPRRCRARGSWPRLGGSAAGEPSGGAGSVACSRPRWPCTRRNGSRWHPGYSPPRARALPRSFARALSTQAPGAAAPPPAPEKTSFGGLKDDDRIFQNIYGRHDPFIKVRAHWALGWRGAAARAARRAEQAVGGLAARGSRGRQLLQLLGCTRNA